MLGALKGKPWVIGLACFLTLVLFYTVASQNKISVPRLNPASPSWEFVTERDERNLGLSEEQCQVRPTCIPGFGNIDGRDSPTHSSGFWAESDVRWLGSPLVNFVDPWW